MEGHLDSHGAALVCMGFVLKNCALSWGTVSGRSKVGYQVRSCLGMRSQRERQMASSLHMVRGIKGLRQTVTFDRAMTGCMATKATISYMEIAVRIR